MVLTNKHLLSTIIIFAFLIWANKSFAQTPPPPPTPPPSPVEVFNKINPFKKKNKDTAAKKDVSKPVAPKPPAPAITPAGAPTPPPPPGELFNKINPFKKKKKDTVSKTKSPAKKQ